MESPKEWNFIEEHAVKENAKEKSGRNELTAALLRHIL